MSEGPLTVASPIPGYILVVLDDDDDEDDDVCVCVCVYQTE